MSEEHTSQLAEDFPEINKRSLNRGVLFFLLLLLGLFIIGTVPRYFSSRTINNDVARFQTTRPLVDTTSPNQRQSASSLSLPGDTKAFQETALYPRANGYLKSILVDIGDRVTKDQLLAEIDAPEVDAQLSQAKASLVRAESELTLALTTLTRYQGFAKSGGVPLQQLDEKRSAEQQARAALAAAQAEVQRLSDLQRYQKVTAPFSGTITAKNYDIGALLSSSTVASGKELFSLQDTSTIKVLVSVPQSYATEVNEGVKAVFTVSNYPGKEFEGVVARTARSLDAETRTLYTEVDIPNPEGLLLPGMYGAITIAVNAPSSLIVPTSALLFDAEGVKVALVQEGKVHLQKVSVGRDFGTEIEVTQGLTGSEEVITNPGQRTTEGQEVQKNTGGQTP